MRFLRLHSSDSQGTVSKEKNELLFSRFGINYNNLPAYFRKGSILLRVDPNAYPIPSVSSDESSSVADVSTPAPGVAIDAERAATAVTTNSTAKPAKRKPFEGTSGEIVFLHEDIIRDPFWAARPWLLA